MKLGRYRSARKRKALAAIFATLIAASLLVTVLTAYILLVVSGDFQANLANQSRQNQIQSAAQESLRISVFHASSGGPYGRYWFEASNAGGVSSTITAVYVTDASGNIISRSLNSPNSQYLVGQRDLNISLPLTVPVGMNTTSMSGCGQTKGCSIGINASSLSYSGGPIRVDIVTASGDIFSAPYPRSTGSSTITTTIASGGQTSVVTVTGTANTATKTSTSATTIDCSNCRTTTIEGQGSASLALSMRACPTAGCASASYVLNGGGILLTANITDVSAYQITGAQLVLAPVGGLPTGTASATPSGSCTPSSQTIQPEASVFVYCQYTGYTGSTGGSVTFVGYAVGTIVGTVTTSAEATSNPIQIGAIVFSGPWGLNFVSYKYESSTQLTPAYASIISVGNRYVAWSLVVNNIFNQTLTILDNSFIINERTGPDPEFFIVNGAPCYQGTSCSSGPTLSSYNCYAGSSATGCIKVPAGGSATVWFATCAPASATSAGKTTWAWYNSGGGEQSGGGCQSYPSWSPVEGDSVMEALFYTFGSVTTGQVYSESLPFESEILVYATTTTVACTPTTVLAGMPTTCTASVKDTSASVTPTGTVQFTSSPTTGTFSSTSCALSGSGSTSTCSVTFTPSAAGTYAITGSYGGDSNNGASSSAPTSITALASSTIPITCTMANSATQATITVSGGAAGPYPTTVLCDGSTHNVLVQASTTITVTEPADGSNTRYRFNNAGSSSTTLTYASCASGTCSPWSFTNYYQLLNTYKSTPNARTTFDVVQVITVSGLQVGNPWPLCTVSTSNGGSAVSCSGWEDYGTVASYSPTTITVGTNERWSAALPTSFTETTGGNTHNVNYYDQLQNTYRATPASPSTWDATYTIPVTGTVVGTSGVTGCTITTASGGGAVTCTGWFDYNTLVTVTSPIVSGSERWAASGANTFTQATGGNTNNVNYYRQHQNTYQATPLARTTWDTSTTIAISGTQLGSATTICTITVTSGGGVASCTGWSDYNTVASYTPISISAGTYERWYAAAPTSFTDTTGGNTHNVNYYDQLSNTYKATPNARSTFDVVQTITISGTQLGSAAALCSVATSNGGGAVSCSGWSDYNTAAAYSPTTITIGTYERWLATGTTSFTDTTGGNTHNVNYYDQLSNTYASTPNARSTFNVVQTITISGTQLGSATTICTVATASGGGAVSCSGWADYNTAASYSPTTITVGTYERWFAASPTSFTQTAGGNNNNVNYYDQLQNTYRATPSVPSTWDAAYNIPVTGTVAGAAGAAGCTITTSNGGGAVTCTGWFDYNTVVTVTSPIVSGNERWIALGTNTFTQTTGGNANNVNYYRQHQNTYQATPLARTTWDTSTSVAISGTQLGSAATVCTITITSGNGMSSCSGWTDYNTAASYSPTTIAVGTYERWQASGTTSFTDTSGDNTHNVNYYDQMSNTYQATPSARSTFDVVQTITISGTQLGSAVTVCSVATTSGGGAVSCSGWTDYNTAASYSPTTITVSTYERWSAASPTSFTETTGGNTHNVNYYDQLSNTYKATPNARSTFDVVQTITISGTQLGSAATICTVATASGGGAVSCSGWTDYNTAASYSPTSFAVGTYERWYAASPTSFTDTTGGNTHNVNYYNQLSNTYTSTPNARSTFDVVQTITISGTQLGSAATICTVATVSGGGAVSCSGWSDYNTAASYTPTTITVSTYERWLATGTTSFTDTTGGNTHNVNYYDQLSDTYTSTPNARSTFDVVQTITISGTQLGAAATICTVATASGGGAVSCSGWSDYNTAAAYSPATITVGTYERWYAVSPTSFTDTTGGNTHNVNYYDQLQNTYRATPSSPSTWDAVYSIPVTGTVAGVTGTTGCTITTTSGGGAVSCSAWFDYNTIVTVTSPIVSGNERWSASSANTFTQTTGGNTNNVNYYRQHQNTYQATPLARTTWDTSTTITISGTQLGSAATICTITVTSGGGVASCAGWSDYNTAAAYSPTSIAVGSYERWQASGTTSFTDTTGGNTHNVNYYDQLSNTYQATPHAPTTWDAVYSIPVTGTVAGTTGTTGCTITTSNGGGAVTCAGWFDYNTLVTVTSPIGSGSERWIASGVNTFTQTTGGNANNVNYYRQYQNTYQATPLARTTWDTSTTVTISGTQLGSAATICSITITSGGGVSSCTGWTDYNTAASYSPTTIAVGTYGRWQASGTTSFTDTTGGNTHNVNYYDQLSNTYKATPNARSTFDVVQTITISGTQLGSAATICTVATASGGGAVSCSGWADYNTAASYSPTTIPVSTYERWLAASPTSFTDTTGGNTHNANYYDQLSNTYQATPLARTTWDTTTSVPISGTYLGASASTICTITITSGGGASSCSGWADYSTAASFSVTTITVSTYERWQASGTTSFTDTSGSNTHNVNYYDQLSNTYKVTPSSPSTWDAVYSIPVTGTVAGTTGTTGCTITTASGGGAVSCSAWFDYNTVVTVTSPLGSGSERWIASGANTFTQTTGNNANNVNYYRQHQNTYQATPLARTTWDTSTTIAISGTQLGSAATVCTITITSGNGMLSCSGWTDYNTLASYATTSIAVGSYERWQATGTMSFTDTSGGNTHNVNYYNQLSNIYKATPSSPSTWDAVYSIPVTGTVSGATGTTGCTITTASGGGAVSCSSWFDYNTVVTVTSPIVSGSERWIASGANTFTQTTGNNANNVNYYRQHQNTYQATPLARTTWDTSTTIAISGTQLGSAATVCTITITSGNGMSSCSGWTDYNTAASYATTSIAAGTYERWQASGTTTFTDTTGGNTHNVNYYDQLSNTYEVTPLKQATWDAVLSPTASGTALGSASTPCTLTTTNGGGMVSCTAWFDYNTLVTLTNPISVSSTERWSASNSYTFTQTTGGNVNNVKYIEQFQVTFSATPSGDGSTLPSGTVWENYGSNQISATNVGVYKFVQWSSTGTIPATFLSSTSASTNATVYGTGTITATFRPYGFDATCVGSGSTSAGNTNTITITMTSISCQSGDLLVVAIASTTYTATVSQITDTSSSTALFTYTTARGSEPGTNIVIYEDYTTTIAAMTSDTITVTMSVSAKYSVEVFGLKGVITTSLFDTHSGLPAVAQGGNTAPTVTGLISTSNPTDIIIALEAQSGTTTQAVGSIAGIGASAIDIWGTTNSLQVNVEYVIVSSTVTSQSATFADVAGSGNHWAMIVDAIDPPAASTVSATLAGSAQASGLTLAPPMSAYAALGVASLSLGCVCLVTEDTLEDVESSVELRGKS